MIVEAIIPQTDPRWMAFVDSHPQSLIFHHPLWMKTLEDAYGYRQASLACIDGGAVVAVLPMLEVRSRLTGRRAVSLPFSDQSAFLTTSDAAPAVLFAWCEEHRAAKGWKYVEFRGSGPAGAWGVSAEYVLHRIALGPDPAAVFKTFDKKGNALSAKRFEKSEGRIERRTDPEAMREFMRLNYATRKKHGVPPQPDKFFESFQRNLLAHGLGFVSLARLNEQTIAASVFLQYHGVVYHKYNASDERHLLIRPNQGLLWDAIRWGCEHGYRVMDLGRSDLDGEGLIKYKRGWGSEELRIAYYRVPAPAAVAARGKRPDLFAPLVRALPMPVFKWVGRVLYEHVG
jgi:hypothetical protein